MDNMKICTKCKIDKSLDDFHNDKHTKDGKSYICKNCNSLARYGKPYSDKRDKNIAKEFDDGTKLCSKCNLIKDKDSFYFMKKLNRHRSFCRECENNTTLKRVYKLSDDEFNQIVEKRRNNICEICNCENESNKNLFVDHNHSTGRIRGVICHNCNVAIGHLRDDVDLARRIIIYLEKHQ
jgi:hypothetical protein